MNSPLADHNPTGKDPIRILEFLARFVREDNIEGMSEVQTFITLKAFKREFLTGLESSKY